MLENHSRFILLNVDLIHRGELNLFRLVGQRTIPVHIQSEKLLFNAHGELLQVFIVVAGQFQKFRNLKYGKRKLAFPGKGKRIFD